MSQWTVSLEFAEGTSSKFWRARVDGKTLYVNYGKIGTAGQTQVKDFSDAAGAQKEYEKLIKEKRKKGYEDAGAAKGDDDEDEDDKADDEDEGGEDADDEDEDDAPKAKAVPAKAAAPAPAPARASGGLRLVLDAGSRKVETTLILDGKTVRMDALESYATPDAAKKAYERLKKTLAGEGYKEG